MDALSASGIKLCPVKDFDQIVEIRAQRHERLRGRNNVTSCRSTIRDFDTRVIKNDLKKKRHLEFLRRRSVSPEPRALRHANGSSKTNPPIKTISLNRHSSTRNSEMPHTDFQNTLTGNGHPMMSFTPKSTTDGLSNSVWTSPWSERGHARTPATTSTQRSVHAQKTDVKMVIQREKIQQRFIQSETILQKKIQREASVQTESGVVNVRESDVQQLAFYLQEALWREEAVKKKLAALQETISNLMNSSISLWTARCREDLLKNKIKALEAQLQVCLLKFPKDGVKKLVLQMEKEKLVYEEKYFLALQRATQDKTEAVSKADSLQEALNTAKAEALRWQSLYEEMKMTCTQFRESQRLSAEQLQQLQSQVELSRTGEAELKEEVESLRQETKELQYNICLLEEDNQTCREQIQHLQDDSRESNNFMMQWRLPSEEAERQVTARRDSQVEEQLRHMQETLQLKERECEDLQTELQAMEQECQSSQARLSQCREELRQLSHRHRRPTPCGSRWKMWMFFLLFLVVIEVALLWLWSPPFRNKVQDLYSNIEKRLEDYLMEMASPQHSGCFRPV